MMNIALYEYQDNLMDVKCMICSETGCYINSLWNSIEVDGITFEINVAQYG